MTVRSSNAVEQAVEKALEQPDVGTRNPESPAAWPPNSTSPLSPASHTTSTSMASSASPFSSSSPLPSASIAAQASTPLSVNTSDTSSSSDPVGGAKPPVAAQGTRLLTPSRSMEALRRTGNLSRSSSSNSTVPVASAAAGPTTSVSAMVESFEQLHRKNSNSNLG